MDHSPEPNVEMETPTVSQEEAMVQIVNLADLCQIPVINVLNPTEESSASNPETTTDGIYLCPQLTQQYGSTDTDIVELFQLLSSWNLADLFPYFHRKTDSVTFF